MGILISHTSALEALRSWELRRRLERGERDSAGVPSLPPTASELAAASARSPQVAGLSRPIDVLVSDGRPGLRASGVIAHRWGTPLPPGSVIELGEGVSCAAPELVAVLMAPSLTDLELEVLLGELMGLYAVAPGLERGMFQREEPLTDSQCLLDYLAALGPRPGTRRVRRALAATSARSGSPRETKLALRLSLRSGLGGYGLRVLSMNDSVEVRRLDNAMAKGVRRPDLLVAAPSLSPGCARRLVAVEYLGSHHDELAQLVTDATRTNELKAVGVGEYVVRKEHYEDLAYMDGLVRKIRHELGQPRIGMTREQAELRRARRQALYEELELIDGVTWQGRERERRRAERAPEGQEWDLVPAEAYGLA